MLSQNKGLLNQFVRYFCVGGISALADWGLFYVLHLKLAIIILLRLPAALYYPLLSTFFWEENLSLKISASSISTSKP